MLLSIPSVFDEYAPTEKQEDVQVEVSVDDDEMSIMVMADDGDDVQSVVAIPKFVQMDTPFRKRILCTRNRVLLMSLGKKAC